MDKARVIAAHLLEASPDDLGFADGRFSVRGDPGAARPFRRSRSRRSPRTTCRREADPVLLAEATFDPENFSYPHGTHLCAAEVDTQTGWVTVRSYVAVDDVGRAVNPLIVEGQIHGGVTQGLAQALYEEAVYDAGGNLVTGSLVDYLVPSAADMPPYVTDRTETPATTNPLGAKGAGESGTIASTPAVVNAVVDALRPYGVTDVPHAVHAGAGMAGDPRGFSDRTPGGAARPPGGRGGHGDPGACRRDPPAIRLRAAADRRRGGGGARRARQREGAGGRAELPADSPAAAGLSGSWSWTWAEPRECGGSATKATSW